MNDNYKPITYGITTYEVGVYDKWGGKITTFTEKSQGWNATGLPLGVYTVTIRALGVDNKWYNITKSVTLIR
ncbi:MAG: hypothetical protein JJ975_16335 [Bacteroidia bacterium]|nr:hypothetical protein [Bacteroidia bacterium]